MTDGRVSGTIIEVLGDPVPAGQVSGTVIEVLGDLPAIGQASGTIIEVLGTQVSEGAVSGLVIEVLGSPPKLRNVAQTGYPLVKAADGQWYPLDALGP
jgi:hypothetical protein